MGGSGRENFVRAWRTIGGVVWQPSKGFTPGHAMESSGLKRWEYKLDLGARANSAMKPPDFELPPQEPMPLFEQIPELRRLRRRMVSATPGVAMSSGNVLTPFLINRVNRATLGGE